MIHDEMWGESYVIYMYIKYLFLDINISFDIVLQQKPLQYMCIKYIISISNHHNNNNEANEHLRRHMV